MLDELFEITENRNNTHSRKHRTHEDRHYREGHWDDEKNDNDNSFFMKEYHGDGYKWIFQHKFAIVIIGLLGIVLLLVLTIVMIMLVPQAKLILDSIISGDPKKL